MNHGMLNAFKITERSHGSQFNLFRELLFVPVTQHCYLRCKSINTDGIELLSNPEKFLLELGLTLVLGQVKECRNVLHLFYEIFR